MAHRKPLGSTFSTTFDWEGPQPELGDYLASQALTFYRVVGVEEKANPKKVGLVLERIADPPADAICVNRYTGAGYVYEDDDRYVPIHRFEWYARDRRRVSSAPS